MSYVVLHIRDFFVNLHGVLLIREHNVPDELQDIHKSVYGDLEMKSCHEDKTNLHGDFILFKKDFKTSVKKYKEEVLNG
ncbi:MAG: hypothetical protein H0U95_11255 [Bacteroidetes bacterium]|nr:hypothetical protein [Bacteroidota bacterium]